MSFIWPVMLLSLILVPLFVYLFIRVQRRRQQAIAELNRLDISRDGGRGISGARSYVPAFLFMVGLSILLIALARPQAVVSLPKVEGTIILAFDVSGSMAADDLKPTRMDAAKAAAMAFVDRQPLTVQIGIVAFSDSGFMVQPPTSDRETIMASINRLTPEKGTSLANGILTSLNAIAQANSQEPPKYYSSRTPVPTPTPTPVPVGTYTSAAVVLLTDGENNETPDPLAAAHLAADRGVRIYPVGIGSTEGAVLHIDGFSIHSKLDDGMLKQIAQITGGEYYSASNEQALLSVYDQLDPQLMIKPEKTEITSVFAGASLLILLIGGVISMLWFGRLP